MTITKMLTCLLIISCSIAASQITNAQGLPCNPKAEGLHYTTPKYSYTPVLFPSMPYDVMFSYILIDSILKHSEDAPAIVKSLFERYENGLVGYDNDTLNYAYKYLYKIMDYDPLLFLERQGIWQEYSYLPTV